MGLMALMTDGRLPLPALTLGRQPLINHAFHSLLMNGGRALFSIGIGSWEVGADIELMDAKLGIQPLLLGWNLCH